MGRVIVAGSVNMDLVAFAPRHPAPGETIAGRSFGTFPGGKGANQAIAASRLGASAALIGRVGDDGFGDELERFLRSETIDLTGFRRVPGTASGVGLIVISDERQNTIVAVAGANAHVDEPALDAVPPAAGDWLVSQLEIPIDTIRAFFERGRLIGARTLLNAAPTVPCPAEILAHADVLVVNEVELEFFSGRPGQRDQEWTAAVRALRGRPDQVVVATLGPAGVLALDGDRVIRLTGHPVRAVDPTGAGDCFVGGLAARLAAGDTLDQALRFANAAAAISVQRAGAAPSLPQLAEVERLLAAGGPPG